MGKFFVRFRYSFCYLNHLLVLGYNFQAEEKQALVFFRGILNAENWLISMLQCLYGGLRGKKKVKLP